MNTNERKIFWEKLCSLEGKDGIAEGKELAKTILLPQFLFRYREIKTETIDALKNNRLYFSSSSYYDDPFDTYLHIDYSKIKELLIKTQGSKEGAIRLFEKLSKDAGLNEDDVAKVIEQISSMNIEQIFNKLAMFLRNEIQPIIRNNSLSVCFSESCNNETMWLKYANQYRGFCVVYSLRPEDEANFLCGKQEKCKNCGIAKYGEHLYPIYYSDKRYDATKYAYNLAHELFLRTFYPQMPNEDILKQIEPCMWEKERVTLIKSKCHEYDKEWRIILPINMNPPVMQEWIPLGVILGLRTSEEDRNTIIQAVKSAGIKHVFQSFIDDNDELNIYEITNQVL